MQVYIVLAEGTYGQMGAPLGVYRTRDEAVAWLKAYRKGCGDDCSGYLAELELGAPAMDDYEAVETIEA